MNTGSHTLPGCYFTANQFCCDCKDNVRLVYTSKCLNPCNGPHKKKTRFDPQTIKNSHSKFFYRMESPTHATTLFTATTATSTDSPFQTPTPSPRNPGLSHQTRSHQYTPFRPNDAASTSCPTCRGSPLTTITTDKCYTQQSATATAIPPRKEKEKKKERRLEEDEWKIPVRMST